jgi:hypothetical protein
MPTTLQEFLNENSHRNYPILDDLSSRDITDSYTLPTSLIVDMQLAAPYGALDGGEFYVSSVVVRRYTVDITISYKPTSELAFAVGSFFNIDTTAGTNQSYSFVPIPQDQIDDQFFSDMSGSVVIGSNMVAVMTPGVWEFDETTAALNPTIVDEGLSQVRSVQVGDQKFYGNIVLKEGTNVTMTPVYEAGTDTTTITVSARLTENDASLVLDNDADILDALISLYGRPITTINNIAPDGSSNFEIEAQDCTQVAAGTNSLILSNPCSEPCCDSDYLDAAYEALNQINIRYARITDFYESATTNIDQIEQRLGLLEAQTGYF